MNEKQLAKLYYLKRLLSLYVKFLKSYNSYSVVFNEKTSEVEVKFYKKIKVMSSMGVEIDSENRSETSFFASDIGRIVSIYKRKMNNKFKTRHNELV